MFSKLFNITNLYISILICRNVTPTVPKLAISYNFVCPKQKKTESLEQFHSDLVELASRADCGDRKDEWVRDMFTAHMNNDKIAEDLLAQTRTPQDAYE